jgi:hypothetical protein
MKIMMACSEKVEEIRIRKKEKKKERRKEG